MASFDDLSVREVVLLLKRKVIRPIVPIEDYIIDGKHIEFIKNHELDFNRLCKICVEGENLQPSILEVLISYVETQEAVPKIECAWQLLVYGVALLELFCQANITGPELSGKDREILNADNDNSLHRKLIHELECDGLYPFNSIDMPQLLILARIIISFVAAPMKCSWKCGISFSREGIISLPTVEVSHPRFGFLCDFADITSNLSSANWWNARATLIHARLLQGQSYEQTPTLWYEAMESFSPMLERFCAIDSSDYHAEELCKFDFGSCSIFHNSWDSSICTEKESRKLSASALIEWGLTCHHFNYGDKVRSVISLVLFFYQSLK